MRRIAISDIHGCLNSFHYLLEQQVQLRQDDELYLLGDFIDRGPDSRGVLDHVMDLQAAGYAVYCLRGNHEDMMLRAIVSPEEQSNWLYNGGMEALSSFGAETPGEIPEKYIRFIREETLLHFQVDRFILVHAGLNFVGSEPQSKKGARSQSFLWKMHNPLQDQEAMMWIRYWYDDINWSWLKDRIIIHGHTPMETHEISDMLDVIEEDQVIDIDNGCFAKYQAGFGKLCAFDFTNMRLYFQENVD